MIKTPLSQRMLFVLVLASSKNQALRVTFLNRMFAVVKCISAAVIGANLCFVPEADRSLMPVLLLVCFSTHASVAGSTNRKISLTPKTLR